MVNNGEQSASYWKKREQEKTVLLQISEQLATIRERDDLFEIVFKQLQPTFQFDQAVVVLFNESLTHTRHLFHFDPQRVTQTDEPFYKQLMSEELEVAGTIYEEIVEAKEPKVISWEYLEDLYAKSVGVQAARPLGFQELLFMPMRYGEKLVGTFEFLSKAKKRFTSKRMPLYASIANQMAVAVSNLLANEQLQEEKQFKETLLSISEVIAGIRDRKQLFATIFERINPVIPIDDTGLLILDKTGKYWQDWTNVDNYQETAGATLLQQMGYDQFQPMDRWMEFALHHTGIITVAQFMEQYQEHPFGSIMYEAGIREFIFTPLMVGGKKLGVLFFDAQQTGTYQKKHIPMFKAIADQLAVAVSNVQANEEIALLNEQLQQENAYLEEEVQSQYNFGEMIIESAPMYNVIQNIQLVAKTDTTVLISGESGTGKELIARSIHEASDRKDQTLIKVNCAALPAQLIESELFGHEKGAFTGALNRRIGKFELASGSTLFLDEIGELSLDLQAKLLRVLQEKEIERVGGNQVIQTDVRIVSATNRDLHKEVQEGRFRSDLYYRLNVFPIFLPSLRERKEEIPLLVNHFIKKNAKKLGKTIKGVSQKAMKQMQSYGWPGNIRELEHVIERSAILCQGEIIKEVYLPQHKTAAKKELSDFAVLKTLAENERDHIMRALEHCHWKVSGAGGTAELLDMKPSTLEFRMKKLGIKRQHIIRKE